MLLQIVIAITVALNGVQVSALDEDVYKTAVELIEKYKYPLETIQVETEDGYILTVYRIKHGLDNADQQNKKPVLLMHDILSSAADFVNMGTRSMAFKLADMNCDVWIANARGSTYSREDADENTSYWDFSWHEIGTKDLPAIIAKMLEVTGSQKIYYIGHGQGTTAFYAMASELPETNDNVALSISLGPVAFNKNLPNPVLRLINSIIPLKDLLFVTAFLTPYEFFPNNKETSELLIQLCDDYAILVEFCAGFLFLMYGFDSTQLERPKVPVILYNAAAGASSKQFFHYAQLFYTDEFRQFDFGTAAKNLAAYGQREPPSYKLDNIKCPVALFYGTNDWLAAVKDVQTLAERLPNVVENYRVRFDDWNHMDFVFARDIEQLLYVRMFELINEY